MEKFAENCKISQKIRVSRQILDKIGVKFCKNWQSERHFNKLSYVLDKTGVQFGKNWHCLKYILINFHIFFIPWKNPIWFLSYVILKFTKSGFPLKIVKLSFWIDVAPVP